MQSGIPQRGHSVSCIERDDFRSLAVCFYLQLRRTFSGLPQVRWHHPVSKLDCTEQPQMQTDLLKLNCHCFISLKLSQRSLSCDFKLLHVSSDYVLVNFTETHIFKVFQPTVSPVPSRHLSLQGWSARACLLLKFFLNALSRGQDCNIYIGNQNALPLRATLEKRYKIHLSPFGLDRAVILLKILVLALLLHLSETVLSIQN